MSELWVVLRQGFPELVAGFLVTARIVAISLALAVAVGTLVAALRAAPLAPLRWLGGLYVESFRNVPLLVLCFLSFAGLRRAGVDVPPEAAATGSLGLYTAAYVAEAIRSGVFAVARGQIEAALSLGFTYARALQKIVLPQAIRTVIPPIGNLIIAMIKNSAVIGVSLITIRPDLLKSARILQNETALTEQTFFWAAIGYLLLTIPATFIVRHLESRLVVRR
ncbi:MAG: amino acid ABC transporter permease [Actinomycetota bacterium]